jgi:hypothetical protein
MTGADHLAVLAREPRPAGGAGEERARDHAQAALRDAGFEVTREPFEYSAFPGRWATPIGGAMAAIAVWGAAWTAMTLADGPASLLVVVSGVLAVVAFAALMLGDAVLTLPLMRARSTNLLAIRRGVAPRVWLVAHLDSKSQPASSLARIGGVALLAGALVLAVTSCALELASLPARMAWWTAIVAAVLGALPVMASVVGARSPGALDNASGVAAVLTAAAQLDRRAAVGVLLSSAEELGLAGARAWARGRPAAIALNCDGVDDGGEMTIMYSGSRPDSLIEAVARMAPEAPRVRRMPLGLLTDSVALASRGWATVTLSRGSLASLQRVHTTHDSLAALRGDGVEEMGTLLARAAEVLA